MLLTSTHLKIGSSAKRVLPMRSTVVSPSPSLWVLCQKLCPSRRTSESYCPAPPVSSPPSVSGRTYPSVVPLPFLSPRCSPSTQLRTLALPLLRHMYPHFFVTSNEPDARALSEDSCMSSMTVNASFKLTFRHYPEIHTNYIISHYTITFYNIIIIVDTVLRQKGNLEHEKLLIQQCCHLSTLAWITKASPLPGHAFTAYAEGRKRETEISYYCCIHIYRRAEQFGCYVTWMVTLSMWWQGCCICISSPSRTVAGEHGKRHAMTAHKRQTVFDWSNPHYLGTILAFGSIAKLV